MFTNRQGEAKKVKLGMQVTQLLSLWPSKQSLDLSSAFLASVHKFAPKQGHWNLPCPHPVLAPQAPEPHPSTALTLVFPGLDCHSPYFGRGGLFLDYAGSPLINLHARWTEKRVSVPGKYTKLSHPPSRLQPGSLTLHGSKILALHASQSLQSLPLPRPAMTPSQSRELPGLLCSNIRTSGYARPRQATPPSRLLLAAFPSG